MKQRINYRAERAERDRKKAKKKEARLAALSRKPEESRAPEDAPDGGDPKPDAHRSGD